MTVPESDTFTIKKCKTKFDAEYLSASYATAGLSRERAAKRLGRGSKEFALYIKFLATSLAYSEIANSFKVAS